MATWRVLVLVTVVLSVLALTGCAELDQLKARNLRLDGELKAAQGRMLELEGELANLRASVGEREDALRAALAEVDLWKGKCEALEARGAGITPELEAELRRLALLDPNIRVKQTQEGFVVEVGTDILFDSGKVELKPQGQATISKIAEVIVRTGTGETLRIDGHTDNVPIRYSGWKDNWHLSAMRAHTVLKALTAKGISEERMYIAGFALYRPEASNDTSEGRQQNRRVEILIVPKLTLGPMPSVPETTPAPMPED